MGVSHPPVGYAGAPMPFACLFPPVAYLATVVPVSCLFVVTLRVRLFHAVTLRRALICPICPVCSCSFLNAIAFLDTFQLCVIRPRCYQKLYTLGLYTGRSEEGAVVWRSAGELDSNNPLSLRLSRPPSSSLSYLFNGRIISVGPSFCAHPYVFIYRLVFTFLKSRRRASS